MAMRLSVYAAPKLTASAGSKLTRNKVLLSQDWPPSEKRYAGQFRIGALWGK